MLTPKMQREIIEYCVTFSKGVIEDDQSCPEAAKAMDDGTATSAEMADFVEECKEQLLRGVVDAQTNASLEQRVIAWLVSEGLEHGGAPLARGTSLLGMLRSERAEATREALQEASFAVERAGVEQRESLGQAAKKLQPTPLQVAQTIRGLVMPTVLLDPRAAALEQAAVIVENSIGTFTGGEEANAQTEDSLRHAAKLIRSARRGGSL